MLSGKTKRQRQIVVALLLAILCTIVFTVYLIKVNSAHFRASIEEQEQANLLTIAKVSAYQISEFLERRSDRLVFLSRDGNIAYALRHDDSKSVGKAVFAMKGGSVGDIAGIYLADEASRLIAAFKSYDIAFEGIDIRFEYLPFARIIKTEKGRAVFLMQHPVMENGMPIGVVGMVMDLEDLSKRFVDPEYINFDGYMQVFDQNATVVVNRDLNALGMAATEYRSSKYPDIDWTEYGTMLDEMGRRPAGSGFYKSIRSMDEPVETRKIAAFAQVPYEGVKWSVLAASDYEEVIESIIQEKDYTAALFAGVLVLFMLAGAGYWLYGKETIRTDELDEIVAERTAELSVALEKLNSDIRMRMEIEERFRLLFTHSTDGILIMDDATGALYGINPAGRRMLNIECDECSRQELERILPAPVLTFIKKHIGSNNDLETREEQVAYADPDSERILLASAASRKVADSRVLYFSFKDVTEKVRLEHESSLRLQQLIQADKMTALGTLVSGVAHEINNPNSFIMTNASIITRIWSDAAKLLDKYPKDASLTLGGLPYDDVMVEVPSLLHGMREGAFRIRSIVSSLKDFARKDDEAVRHPISLNKVINEAIVILGNRLKKLGADFHVSLDERIPLVLGIPQQLEQVVINLLINSLDAVKTEGKGIWVGTSLDHESGMVRLVVRDEGIGMSEDDIRRAAEPFYTTKQASGGTGLGLYISFNIIKDHGADLSFHSEPGAGTTATVLIPVA